MASLIGRHYEIRNKSLSVLQRDPSPPGASPEIQLKWAVPNRSLFSVNMPHDEGLDVASVDGGGG
jgi:hypothetical protein